VLGFNHFTTLTATNLIVGIALALLALTFAPAYSRTHGITWATPLIGVWTIIAPWVVSGHFATPATLWSNIVTGAIAILLGLSALSLKMNRTH
jgi:SPW repeat